MGHETRHLDQLPMTGGRRSGPRLAPEALGVGSDDVEAQSWHDVRHLACSCDERINPRLGGEPADEDDGWTVGCCRWRGERGGVDADLYQLDVPGLEPIVLCCP